MSIDYPGGGGPGTGSGSGSGSGMGDTDRGNWWKEWRRENGQWVEHYHPGKPPKGATRRAGGWVVPKDEPNEPFDSDSSKSTSTTKKKDEDPYNEKPPPRNGRPPYYQPERYFDAVQNKWRWKWRYVPTNAEVLARRAGLEHDSRGYYRMRSGRRSYVTGRLPSGRRYHWDMQGGERRKVWDDPYRWPGSFNERRRKLRDQRAQLKSRLESLREQYRKSRSDQHLLRRNIMRRTRQIEASVRRIEASLKRMPRKNPFLLDFSKAKPRLHGGIRVTLDFARDPDDGKGDQGARFNDLSFSPTVRVGRNTKVWVRATISIEERLWRPGMLGAPEAMRVRWTVPRQWLALGGWKNATDEFTVSNPIYIVRPFRSPGQGRNHEPKFSVRAEMYEFSFNNPGGAYEFEGL